MTVRSIGLRGSTDPDVIRRVAPRIERLGYRALWLNDGTGGGSLAGLAAAAEATTTLQLACGVIPLDRLGGEAIAHRIAELGLPIDRLRVGVGSGASPHPLGLLEREIGELRSGTDARIVVGALGPKARALAARIADGILFNWLTPEAADAATRQLRADAPAGASPEGILYVRTIGEEVARPALRMEAERYLSIPSYAANFRRLGIDPVEASIDLSEGRAVPDYGALDELVLRAITATDSVGALLRLIETGAPTP